MYQSLLLETGGGIVSNTQQSQQDDAPVVVIGVGGTGAKALDRLKKKVYKQLIPDDLESDVPTYNHIRFLEIDSDAEWVAGTGLNYHGEFVNLQDPHVKDKFAAGSVNLKNLMEKPQFQWFEADKISIPTGLNGAGGLRQLGRYLLINESQLVYQKIKEAINLAISGRESGDLVIHIMAGISGGMGSGCFIDTCYIVRKVLADMAIGGATVFGYFFLPDVITTIPAVAASTIGIDGNYRNGYAALLELDYLMNLKENQGRFVQDYGNFKIDTSDTPVDMCHLVSALDARGNTKDRAFDYSMNVVADYVMSYLAKAEGTEAITPKGNLVNIEEKMNQLKVEYGAYNRYHVMGASNAEMPMTQIATYLATELYKKMSGSLLRLPIDQDVMKFAEEKMGFTVPALKKRMKDKVKPVRPVPIIEKSIAKQFRTPYVHPEAILRPMDDWLFEQQGQIEKNYHALNTELKSFDANANANATALIGELFNKLLEMCDDTTKGPCYAAAMLNRIGKDLQDVLQGLHLEAEKQTKEWKHQADHQSEVMENAKQIFVNSKKDGLIKKHETEAYENYLFQVSVWYQRRLEVSAYENVDKLIIGLKSKVNSLYQTYFGKLKKVLEELNETFDANAHYFEGGHADDPADDGFTMRIMEFRKVKPHLDDVLSQTKPEDAMGALVRILIENAEIWLSDDEYQIGRLVNKFISEQFTDEMNKTLQSYLTEKYPGLKPGEIVGKLQTDLYIPLRQKSEPLFWCSPNINVKDVVSMVNLSFPNDATDIKNAAENFKDIEQNCELRPSRIGDRIFMLRFYSGLPLYGYHGLGLMKEKYDKAKKEGLHLYGREGERWADTLITPIPYSLNANLVKNGDRVAKAFEVAKEAGIIRIQKSGELVDKCTLNAIENEEMVQFLNAMGCYGDNKVEDFDEFKEMAAYKDLKEQYFTSEEQDVEAIIADKNYEIEKLEIAIRREKNQEYEVAHHGKEKIALDNIIHSPVLTRALMDSVAFYEGLQMAKERLELMNDEAAGDEVLLNTFVHALATGILEEGIGKILFTYVEKRTEEEEILYNKNMPYAKFKYFQAFLSFKEMDEDIRELITEQAEEKMDNLQEGDDEQARKILKKLSPSEMKKLKLAWKKDKLAAEIDEFYTKFIDLLEDYVDAFE